MRVAIVHIPVRDPEALSLLAKAMAATLGKAGHVVEVVDGRADDAPRLTGFDYVIVGTEPAGIRGKLPDRVASYLPQAGMLAGKRSMAFVRKAAFGSDRALRRLMSAMEAEGMRVNCAEVVSGAQEAAEAAASAPIERAAAIGGAGLGGRA